MARQRSEVLIDGKVGNLSFYPSKYGYLVRSIGKPSKEKFNTDPKQAARKDATQEFGYASKVGKLFRLGVKQCMPHIEIGSTHYRLAALIRKAVLEDNVNKRGERRLMANNVGMLKGFDWREKGQVGLSLRIPYTVALDVAGGVATLDISGIVPLKDIDMGEGVSHMEIVLVVVAVDDVKGTQVSAFTSSGMIDVTGSAGMDVNLSCALPPTSGKILMAGIGVQGYQEVSGRMMEMRSGGGFEAVDWLIR